MARAGRPRKGGKRTWARFPDDQYEVHQAAAAAAGMTFSDWIANQVAKATGLEEPWPSPRRNDDLTAEMAA